MNSSEYFMSILFVFITFFMSNNSIFYHLLAYHDIGNVETFGNGCELALLSEPSFFEDLQCLRKITMKILMCLASLDLKNGEELLSILLMLPCEVSF
jgi:hypothetical protein